MHKFRKKFYETLKILEVFKDQNSPSNFMFFEFHLLRKAEDPPFYNYLLRRIRIFKYIL